MNSSTIEDDVVSAVDAWPAPCSYVLLRSDAGVTGGVGTTTPLRIWLRRVESDGLSSDTSEAHEAKVFRTLQEASACLACFTDSRSRPSYVAYPRYADLSIDAQHEPVTKRRIAWSALAASGQIVDLPAELQQIYSLSEARIVTHWTKDLPHIGSEAWNEGGWYAGYDLARSLDGPVTVIACLSTDPLFIKLPHTTVTEEGHCRYKIRRFGQLPQHKLLRYRAKFGLG